MFAQKASRSLLTVLAAVSLSFPSIQDINPVLERVINNPDGTFTASFGYNNPNSSYIEISVGPQNYFSGGQSQDLGQTVRFRPGRIQDAFFVIFNGSNLVWHLNGHTSTASSGNAVTPLDISPVLERVIDNDNATYTAIFGYKNPNAFPIVVTRGTSQNGFAYHGLVALDKGQPERFEPGRQYARFTVEFDGANLVWNLTGHTATASSTNATCRAVPTANEDYLYRPYPILFIHGFNAYPEGTFGYPTRKRGNMPLYMSTKLIDDNPVGDVIPGMLMNAMDPDRKREKGSPRQFQNYYQLQDPRDVTRLSPFEEDSSY